MRFNFLAGAAVAAMIALPVAAQSDDAGAPDRRFTAERVFDLEIGADPQISPDGRTVVYVRRSMDRMTDRVRGELWTLDVETGAHRPLVAGEGSAGAPRWSPDGDRLLYMTAAGGKPQLKVRYMDSGQTLSLAQFEHTPRGAVWSPDGTTIAFTKFTPGTPLKLATPPARPEGAEWAPAMRVFDDLVFRFDGQGYLEEGTSHVFTLTAEGGSPRQVTFGEADFGSAEWLGNGTLLVVGNTAEDRDTDFIESEIFAVDLATTERTALTDRDGPDGNPKASPDGTQIAYLGYDDDLKSYQQTDLYVMGADGSEPRLLTGAFDRSIDQITWRPDGNAVLALIENQGGMDIVSIDLDGEIETAVTGVGGTSFGRPYSGGSFSVSEGRRPTIAYTAASTDRPAEIAVAGRTVDDRVLTDLNGDLLAQVDMAPIEAFTVASSVDGREIEAWVALPPGFTADGSHPMIIEIHGGPFAMYGAFFAAEIQRFAAEGYVTVYVNPRGSTGYGEEFAQLIDLAYPGDDAVDLLDVVDDLVARDYVDPDRLFVTGGSGGGILTAWLVGTDDRFAAAASIKPVINWMTMALAADIAPFVKRHWVREKPWENADAYLDRSPIMLIENVTTPTLLMVGEEDWRTPTWEAEQFYTALHLKGVETALIRVPGAAHSIAARPSHLIAKVDNIMGWFKRHDPTEAEEE